MTAPRPRRHPQDDAPAEVRAILEERARRLLQAAAVEQEEEVAWLAEFTVAGERYALPLEQVRGCTRFRNVTPVPLARRTLLGIHRHEGRVLPVYALAALLGQPWSGDPSALVVLEPTPGRWVAVDAEAAPLPIQVPAAALAAARVSGGAIAHLATAGTPLRVVSLAALLDEEASR